MFHEPGPSKQNYSIWCYTVGMPRDMAVNEAA
jgi:hypothetical protein